MSETPTAAVAAAPARPKKLLVLILAVAGLAAGTSAGAFVAAPLLASKSAAAATPAGGAVGQGKAHGKEGAGEAAAAPIIFSMENLVLNPAGTSGTRFLMATVAVELSDAKYLDKLKEREAETRDILVSLLGRKTVDELSDATRRDAFRAEANAAIAPLLPKQAIRRVFFPQFVIQ